jgi:succinate dehydrogenase / fumarate reductase, iron-sulfur subunit
MNLTLKIWRQKNRNEAGRLEEYKVHDISDEMSFLEMLDTLNEQLMKDGREGVAFDHDCREGICGMCSLVVNGMAHGPEKGTTVCQLHMRSFKDGDTIVIEPWRATAFPIMRDLVVDRTSMDEIIQAGGYVSVNTGNAQDANSLPIAKPKADLAMDAAACIGCGACIASCKNASAMLFVAAKVSHLNLLPQGQVEKEARVLNMVAKMDELGFGNCTNQYECEAACPKEIKVSHIARMNRQYLGASFFSTQKSRGL